MNQLGTKLAAAIDAKNNDISLFVWKGPKKDVNGARVQDEIKLVDATDEQLRDFYVHCMSMLYNTDNLNPGRLVLLDIIKDQRERCNTELFLRFLENAYLPTDRQKIQRFTYLQSVKTFMENNKDLFPKDQLGNICVTSVTGGVPDDFRSITLDYILDGSLDRLGNFNKKHITLKFLTTTLGMWFTPQEKREFTEESKITGKAPIDIVKERCGLKQTTSINTNPKSLLNYKEFRAMVTLKNKKYSEMTTDQLVTLRNKVLFALEDLVEYQATQWEERIRQIKKVADERNLVLDDEG